MATYSAQKKKLSTPKLAKNFFPIDVSQIYFAPLYYGWSFALGQITNIRGKFQPRSGAESFFF